jgi:hypothetical protein
MKQSMTLRDAAHVVRTGMRRSSSRLRPLPDFLIIGGQRCGTTSLYHYLGAHPDVLPPSRKEVQFFSRHWTRGEGWYRAHFPLRGRKTGRRPTARQTFEATPYYLVHPLAPARAAELLPNAKLVVLLRDPVMRAWSHYHHMVRLGLEPLSFEEAIEREPARLAGELERIESDPRYDPVHHRRYSYLTRGEYAQQLQQWLRHFPPDRFLVLRSEALFSDPAECYRRVLAHLDLAQWAPSSFAVHTRQSGVKSTMPVDIRRQLETHFAPANEQLEELLRQTGIDGSWALPATAT